MLLFITVHLINVSQVQIVSTNSPPIPPVTASIPPTGLLPISKESFHHSPHLSTNPVVFLFFLSPSDRHPSRISKMTEKWPKMFQPVSLTWEETPSVWRDYLKCHCPKCESVCSLLRYSKISEQSSRYCDVFTANQCCTLCTFTAQDYRASQGDRVFLSHFDFFSFHLGFLLLCELS